MAKYNPVQYTGEVAEAAKDCALYIDKLPFKMTVSMMLEIACYAVILDFYQDAEDIVRHIHKISISDDTIRYVVDYLSKLIFDDDCRIADDSIRSLISGNADNTLEPQGAANRAQCAAILSRYRYILLTLE